MELVKIVIAVGLAMAGWLVGHVFTARRDHRNRLTELRISRLYDAYSKMFGYLHSEVTQEAVDSFQSALADIQAIGKPELIKSAEAIVDQMLDSRDGGFHTGDLVAILRDAIRKELHEEMVTDRPFKPIIKFAERPEIESE